MQKLSTQPLGTQPLSTRTLNWFLNESQKRDAKLLPLRLFIGLGWIRAGVAKLIDPEWYSGDLLIEFLQANLLHGGATFPIYNGLMMGLFTEHASFLSNLVTAGQLYTGLAIFFGIFTRPALLAGLFMNMNFVLAGTVNPSAFYMIIQLTLLTSNVGRVLGIDGFLNNMRGERLHERAETVASERFRARLFFSGCLCNLILLFVTAPYIQTIHPADSIEDPAMLLVILFGLYTLLCLILGTQAVIRQRELTTFDMNNRKNVDAYLSPLAGMPASSAPASSAQ